MRQQGRMINVLSAALVAAVLLACGNSRDARILGTWRGKAKAEGLTFEFSKGGKLVPTMEFHASGARAISMLIPHLAAEDKDEVEKVDQDTVRVHFRGRWESVSDTEVKFTITLPKFMGGDTSTGIWKMDDKGERMAAADGSVLERPSSAGAQGRPRGSL